MTKQRRYLKDLLRISVNDLILKTGYWETRLDDGRVISLAPEQFAKKFRLILFINNCRTTTYFEISAQPHRGKLRNGASIPYRYDERYFVIGSNGKRYADLYYCPESCRLGTRVDFYPPSGTWNAYDRRKRDDKSFKEQCRAMEKELFQERDEFLREHNKRVK